MNMYQIYPSQIINCGLVSSPYYLLKDVASPEFFDRYALRQYFEKNKDTFNQVLQKLYDSNTPFEEEDEKHLVFMLESLIHARGELTVLKSIEN
jgi:hypothetical protein